MHFKHIFCNHFLGLINIFDCFCWISIHKNALKHVYWTISTHDVMSDISKFSVKYTHFHHVTHTHQFWHIYIQIGCGSLSTLQQSQKKSENKENDDENEMEFIEQTAANILRCHLDYFFEAGNWYDHTFIIVLNLISVYKCDQKHISNLTEWSKILYNNVILWDFDLDFDPSICFCLIYIVYYHYHQL